MKFDDVLDQVGSMGVYQLCVFLMLSLLSVLGIESIAFSFVAGFMDHWCEVDDLSRLPYEQQLYILAPYDEEDEEYASCEMYNHNYSAYSPQQLMTWNTSQMADNTTELTECQSWVYDQSQYKSTIRSQWDLVCDDVWTIPVSQMIYMIGVFLGAIGVGYTNDKWGRRPTMYVCIWLKVIGNMLSTFAPTLPVYVLGRFIVGAGGTGAYLSAFVMGKNVDFYQGRSVYRTSLILPCYVGVMEIVSSLWRTILGVSFQIAFSIGFMSLPIVAYFIREHMRLQFTLYAPSVIFLGYWWLIPESPRWLVLNRKYKEAERVMRRMAKINRKQIPDDLNLDKLEEDVVEQGSCTDLMKSGKLRMRSCIVCLHWFTDSLIYYTLSMSTGALHGDMYVNTFISGAVEVPANLFCMLFLSWRPLGRRGTCSWSLIIAGLACFLSMPLILNDLGTASTTVSMIGKAFVTIGFSGIYIYTSELFPTDVRGVAMSTAVISARISGIAAPFMGAPMANVWAALPSLIFGILATISGILTFFLPETLGQQLFDTVEEMQAWDRKVAAEKEDDLNNDPIGKEHDETGVVSEVAHKRYNTDLPESQENNISRTGTANEGFISPSEEVSRL